MRNAEISIAAMETVANFGIQKTTMADIAEAAGVSRQTLYNAYPNKEEVMRSAVRYFMEQDLARLSDAWANVSTIQEKLDTYFEKGPVKWYDTMQEMPNASELMEGISNIVEPELLAAHSKWVQVLAQLFRDTMSEKKANELADFVFNSAKNAKIFAENREQFISRLRLLKNMVISTYY